MKKIYLIIVTAFFISSCAEKKEKSIEDVIATKDLKQLRAKKATLDAEQLALSDKIKLLSDEISKLDTNKKVPLITTFKVEEKPFVHYLELQGNVQTKKNVLIYPETPGQITTIYVREGQRVVKGQVLAKIDAGGLSNQLAQAKASEEFAKTTFERQKRLWNQKIGSEIQFLQAQTNYKAQKNAVANIRKVLAKYTVKAPFSGVIDDVIKEQGTVVAPGPGAEIFRIVNLGDMYVETDVPESYITSIKKGKSVEVEFPILGKSIQSKVRQAGSFINPVNRTFKVEIGIPNKDRSIKPNLTAKLKLNDYTSQNAILISQSIISENAKGQQYVFVVSGIKEGKGIAKKVIITTGKIQGDFVEVLSGLKANDQLVQEGARSVQDGQEVEIRN